MAPTERRRNLEQVSSYVRLGGNASGKSTTLKTILGTVRPGSDPVLFDGNEVTNLGASQRIARGF